MRILATTAAPVLVGLLAAACGPPPVGRPDVAPALLGSTTAYSTSRADLTRTIAMAQTVLAENPVDSASAIRLADALLRQARVTGNAGLTARAAAAVERVTASDPHDYGACRMLAAARVAAHAFDSALAEGRRCLQLRADDAWLLGVIGDAHLELGHYDEAFDAFDRMLALKPTAAAYGRASYARELQGDLDGALAIMQMALEATPPQDPESLAWHHAQIGQLHLQRGRLDDADRAFRHADFVFPGHPLGSEGLARVVAARGDTEDALVRVDALIERTPAPHLHALAGQLAARLGRNSRAERHYQLAEAGWLSDAPDPTALARFLAEHGRRLDLALRLARDASTVRDDIFTNDALAWAEFQHGHLDAAAAAIARAQRTGTADAAILAHAAAIAAAVASEEPARAR